MNPRAELEARYPEADFSVYFRFLDACCGTEKALDTQEHHICPRKQFPEFIDASENLITLRVDDHAFAHKLLEAACGIKAPSTVFFEAQTSPEFIKAHAERSRRHMKALHADPEWAKERDARTRALHDNLEFARARDARAQKLGRSAGAWQAGRPKSALTRQRMSAAAKGNHNGLVGANVKRRGIKTRGSTGMTWTLEQGKRVYRHAIPTTLVPSQ